MEKGIQLKMGMNADLKSGPEVADYPYLRYPLLIESRALRDKLLEKLIKLKQLK